MIWNKLPYFVINCGNVEFKSRNLQDEDVDKYFKLCSAFSLPEEGPKRDGKLDVGLFTLPWGDDALIGFVFRGDGGPVAIVCILPGNVAESLVFHEAAEQLWNSVDFRGIAGGKRPPYLQFDGESEAETYGKYPFVTLSMDWPDHDTGFIFLNRHISRLLRSVRRQSRPKVPQRVSVTRRTAIPSEHTDGGKKLVFIALALLIVAFAIVSWFLIGKQTRPDDTLTDMTHTQTPKTEAPSHVPEQNGQGISSDTALKEARRDER